MPLITDTTASAFRKPTMKTLQSEASNMQLANTSYRTFHFVQQTLIRETAQHPFIHLAIIPFELSLFQALTDL